MIDLLLWPLLACVAVLALAAMAVPVSALVWWAGWSRRADPQAGPPPPLPPPAPGPFLVYLSGVGDISGEYSTRYEDRFLEAVAGRVPGLAVVTDVFAYSVENRSMVGEQRLGWFWRWVNDVRLRSRGPLRGVGKLIAARNVLHIAASADRRYGPIYNYGVAEMVIQGLLRQGYPLGSGAPVSLLGYSGGGQIALAAAGHIQATLRAPVQVISLAGIMNSSRSLDRISALTHLYGTRDHQHLIGDLIFPARWPLFSGSRWSRAVAAGKVRRICLGPMRHGSRGGYLDDTLRLADGRSYMAVTADAVAELIRRLG